MAESILRLKVESQEYDQKIKRAAEGIQQYAQKCREVGGTLEHLDDGVLEFVQALGKMDTVASNTKQQLREMSNALTTLTTTYRGLTDEEKASPFGKELSRQIDMLTERAGAAQDAMIDVQQSIRNAASDTRGFDQLASGMTMLTSTMQTAQGAAKLLGVELGDNVEVIAKLQAAMAVTSGLQQMQTLLQKQSALMQGINALQKEFNLLAKANPYVLLASAVAAVAGAYLLWSSNGEKAKKAQESLNSELNNTKNQLAQIDKDTDFSVGIAEAAGKSWKAIHDLRLEAARTKLQLADMNYDKLFASGASKEQMQAAADMQQQAWDNVMKVLNEGVIHDVKMRSGGGRTKGSGSGSGAVQTEEQLNSAQIERLTQEYITATTERRTAIEREIEVLQQRNAEIQKLKDMAQGKQFEAGSIGEVTVTGNKNRQYGRSTEGNISAVISNLQNELKNADIGSSVYDSIVARLADANAYKNVVQTAMQAGLNDMALDSSGIWKQIVNGDNIDDSTWENMISTINEKLAELDLEPIKLNLETGTIEQDGKKAEKAWNLAAQAVSNVGSAFSSIEDPGVKAVGTVMQAIASIALGFSMASANANTAGTGWGWLAWLAAGTAAMATTISTIHSLTGYAEGGIVKGNSYSGDNIYAGNGAMVNAGELILSRSQQLAVASQLQSSSPFGGGRLVARLKGADLLLSIERELAVTGKGELATFK